MSTNPSYPTSNTTAYLDAIFEPATARRLLGSTFKKNSNTAVVYMCHDRHAIIHTCLGALLSSQSLETCDLIISQDGGGEPLASANVKLPDTLNTLYVHHKENLCIGVHHHFIKQFVFESLGYEHMIVVEEDNCVHPQAVLVLRQMLDASIDDCRIGVVGINELDNSVLLDEHKQHALTMRANVDLGHLWVFGMHVSRYLAIRHHLQDYLAIIRGKDYRKKDVPPLRNEITAMLKLKGMPTEKMSQDVMVVNSLIKEGYTQRLTTLFRLFVSMGWSGVHFSGNASRFYNKFGRGMLECKITGRVAEADSNDIKYIKRTCTERINMLYKEHLGRNVDPGALDSTLDRLITGKMNAVELVYNITTSNEYRSCHQLDCDTTAKRIEVLTERLAPYSPFDVDESILLQAKAADIVQQLYMECLGRPYDDEGRANSINAIVNGRLSPKQLRDSLLSSAEGRAYTQWIATVRGVAHQSTPCTGQCIKYYAHADGSGYSSAAALYMQSLISEGVNLHFQPLNYSDAFFSSNACGELCAYIVEPVRDQEQHDFVIIHTIPDNISRIIEYEKSLARRNKWTKLPKFVCMTVWETDKIPDSWVQSLNKVDMVMVPNGFNVRVFRQCGVVRPIYVVPHPMVGLTVTEEQGTEDQGQDSVISAMSSANYCFYTVNEFNGRKNLSVCIEAYFREFSKVDNVILYIKTNSKDVTEKEVAELVDVLASKHGKCDPAIRPDVHIDFRFLQEHVINTIHHQGDCFVSTARSEGVGMGAVTAALLGKHLVYVPYGGIEHYLGADTCIQSGLMALPYKLTAVCFCPPIGEKHKKCGDVCQFNPVYYPSMRWADVRVDDVCHAMRACFSMGRSIKKTHSSLPCSQFSIKEVGIKFISLLG